MSEAAERFKQIYDENTEEAEDRSLKKPSEIKRKEKELEKKIEKFEKRKQKLTSRRLNQGERYARYGSPCPECGSKKTPKVSSWSYIVTATCRDCGFEGRCDD